MKEKTGRKEAFMKSWPLSRVRGAGKKFLEGSPSRAPTLLATPTSPCRHVPPSGLVLFPDVALLATACLAAASDELELTEDNFESRVSNMGSAGLMLAKLFAPWCGHCKRLAAEYEATRFKGIVPLAEADCTASTNTCNKYGVSGYPALKIFRDGEEAGAYDGPRTADGSVSHAKKQAEPASVPLRTEEEFEKFVSYRCFSGGFFGGLIQ